MHCFVYFYFSQSDGEKFHRVSSLFYLSMLLCSIWVFKWLYIFKEIIYNQKRITCCWHFMSCCSSWWESCTTYPALHQYRHPVNLHDWGIFIFMVTHYNFFSPFAFWTKITRVYTPARKYVYVLLQILVDEPNGCVQEIIFLLLLMIYCK